MEGFRYYPYPKENGPETAGNRDSVENEKYPSSVKRKCLFFLYSFGSELSEISAHREVYPLRGVLGS